jgi:uncharacterized protein (DUF1684 family)
MDEAQWRAGLEAARREKDQMFREEFTPMMGAKAAAFRGLEFYDPDPAYRVAARLEPGDGARVRLATSTGSPRDFIRYGRLVFAVDGQEQRLSAFRALPSSGGEDSLFVPFRDATSGHETYGAGRYLDLPFDAGAATYLVDFNDAYNPLCAYSPYYSCPYPPPENLLAVPIRAGERYSGDE